MNTKKFLNGLSSIAESTPRLYGVKIVSAITIKNNVISIGQPSLKTHPLQAKYAKNQKSIFLHAEIDAIQKALRIITPSELEKATLYICRIKYINHKPWYGNSCPCLGCRRAIEAFQLSKVIYTLDSPTLEWRVLK